MSISGKFAAVISVFFLVPACSPDHQSSAPSKEEPVESAAAPSLIVRGDRLHVSMRVNGVQTNDALLDSGAEISFLDKLFGEKVGRATAGREK